MLQKIEKMNKLLFDRVMELKATKARAEKEYAQHGHIFDRDIAHTISIQMNEVKRIHVDFMREFGVRGIDTSLDKQIEEMEKSQGFKFEMCAEDLVVLKLEGVGDDCEYMFNNCFNIHNVEVGEMLDVLSNLQKNK